MALYEGYDLWREVVGRAGVTLITLPVILGFFVLSAAVVAGRAMRSVVRARRPFEPLLP